jgi:hypothetical protein
VLRFGYAEAKYTERGTWLLHLLLKKKVVFVAKDHVDLDPKEEEDLEEVEKVRKTFEIKLKCYSRKKQSSGNSRKAA